MFIDISDCQEINRRREHNNKNKRKQKKGKKQNKKKGGGGEEIKTENDGKQTKDWGEWKERDHYKINTKNNGNQLK